MNEWVDAKQRTQTMNPSGTCVIALVDSREPVLAVWFPADGWCKWDEWDRYGRHEKLDGEITHWTWIPKMIPREREEPEKTTIGAGQSDRSLFKLRCGGHHRLTPEQANEHDKWMLEQKCYRELMIAESLLEQTKTETRQLVQAVIAWRLECLNASNEFCKKFQPRALSLLEI